MPQKTIEQSLRAAFIACLIVVAILALLPADLMRRTALGGHVEHAIVYLGTAILMGLAFPRGPQLTVQCVLLTMYASALEVGQLYSPGRHASFRDLAFSAAGIAIGGVLLGIARTRMSSGLRCEKPTA
jgi:VanZ family protein